MNKLKIILLAGTLLALNAVAFPQTALVKSKQANLRGTPSMKGKIVDRLAKQTPLEVIKQQKVWFLVQSPEYVGWIHGDTITLSEKTAVVEDLPVKNVIEKTATPKSKSSTRTYIRGSRGGCYYINASGNKTYVIVQLKADSFYKISKRPYEENRFSVIHLRLDSFICACDHRFRPDG